MEINISDLTWSKFIYPRGGKSEKTVEAYVEALAIGAQFPPIKIQRVNNYTPLQTATLILDGIHRFFAFKQSGIKKIAAVEWKNKPLDYEKNKISLLLESAECNISHGDRLDAKDKKRIARDIAATDPECIWTESALAGKLGVIRQTINTWISDIRARQKASQTQNRCHGLRRTEKSSIYQDVADRLAPFWYVLSRDPVFAVWIPAYDMPGWNP